MSGTALLCEQRDCEDELIRPACTAAQLNLLPDISQPRRSRVNSVSVIDQNFYLTADTVGATAVDVFFRRMTLLSSRMNCLGCMSLLTEYYL
jgi:hypothetical protein